MMGTTRRSFLQWLGFAPAAVALAASETVTAAAQPVPAAVSAPPVAVYELAGSSRSGELIYKRVYAQLVDDIQRESERW